MARSSRWWHRGPGASHHTRAPHLTWGVQHAATSRVVPRVPRHAQGARARHGGHRGRLFRRGGAALGAKGAPQRLCHPQVGARASTTLGGDMRASSQGLGPLTTRCVLAACSVQARGRASRAACRPRRRVRGRPHAGAPAAASYSRTAAPPPPPGPPRNVVVVGGGAAAPAPPASHPGAAALHSASVAPAARARRSLPGPRAQSAGAPVAPGSQQRPLGAARRRRRPGWLAAAGGRAPGRRAHARLDRAAAVLLEQPLGPPGLWAAVLLSGDNTLGRRAPLARRPAVARQAAGGRAQRQRARPPARRAGRQRRQRRRFTPGSATTRLLRQPPAGPIMPAPPPCQQRRWERPGWSCAAMRWHALASVQPRRPARPWRPRARAPHAPAFVNEPASPPRPRCAHSSARRARARVVSGTRGAACRATTPPPLAAAAAELHAAPP